MVIAPSSTVRLLNVPLDGTQKNQLFWHNHENRIPYFNSKIKHQYNDVTYIRKDKILKIPALIDSLYDSNYVMYQNTAYGDHWFFAFITRMEYVNDGMTHVYIETDVFQTWYSEFTFLPSFVEREHVLSDTPGEHLIPESFEYGDHINYGQKTFINLNTMVIVVAYIDIVADADVIAGSMRDNVFTALKYVWYTTSPADITALNELLDGFASIGKLENIVNIFMVPYYFTSDPELATPTTLYNARPTNFEGYTPKNKKLLTYPYTFLDVSNCQGTNVPFKFEYFDNPGEIDLAIYFAFNDKPSCMLVPLDYKDNPANWDEGIVLNKFPVCAWNGDVYKNWYAKNEIIIEQQKFNNFIGLAGGAGMAAISAYTGNFMGAAAGAGVAFTSLQKTMDLLVQLENKKLFPEQLMQQQQNVGINCAWDRVGYEVKRKTIKREFAEIIDGFFEMYGYKVNKLKVPTLSNRPFWNFVKTVDANITGPIPTDDMEVLKTLFNNGITLWHDPALFGDYSQNNH